MKNLMNYIDNQSFLSELLDKNKSLPTSQLGDLWSGIACIVHIIQEKYLENVDYKYKLNGNFCFISNKSNDFLPNLITCNEFIDDQELTKLYPNICDLEFRDLQKIRDKYIFNTIERKKYDRNNRIKSYVFGCSVTDYISLLGSKSEKSNGLLCHTIPIVTTETKRKDTGYATNGEPGEYYSQLIRFAEQTSNFNITNRGFQQYNKWCIHHVPKRGYYGQILDELIKEYCLTIACCLCFNDKRDVIQDYDVNNALKILEITADEAIKMFEDELNINDTSKYIKVLEKVKQFLLAAGSNGMQHRSLYLKVHHDIDNETFRYIMTLLHEFGIIEKLKVNSNSFIYRGTENLSDFDIKDFLDEVKIIS